LIDSQGDSAIPQAGLVIDELSDRIARALRTVPDFPTTGVMFRDITPLLADHSLMLEVVQAMSRPFMTRGITHVVGIESRGFMFGVPIAFELRASFVPARKPGRLPWTSMRENYALEYGDDALEIHVDAIQTGARVLIVDDVLATGGTAGAASRLVGRLGGQLCGVSVLTEIPALGGRASLSPIEVHSLLAV